MRTARNKEREECDEREWRKEREEGRMIQGGCGLH